MSTIQADVGRQGKVLIIGGVIALLALGYIFATYRQAAAAKQSSAVAIQQGHGTPSAESEHYGDVLNRYNKKNAHAAEESGTTYVSVLSSRSNAVPEHSAPNINQQAPVVQAPPAPAPPIAAASPAPAMRVSQSNPRNDEGSSEQFQALMLGWTATAHTEARTGELGDATRVLAPVQSPVVPGAPRASDEAQKLVDDFVPIPAILETEIDTDENSIVSAFIPSGTYAGAKVFAPGYKRVNNTVDLTFTSMKFNGRSYKINAKALDKNSLRSTLSGEVNHRYFSRIIIPALALGLGRAGQLFEQADTHTIVTPIGIIRSRTGPPSGKAVAGTVLGGTAQQAGQVLTQDAAQVPAKQVIIARNETIGILFLEPVFSTSEMTAPAPPPAQ